jgi:hypothetical protein
MVENDRTHYPESHTDGSKKGTVSDAGYNEQNTKHNDETQDIPAPPSHQDKPASSPAPAGQDDTGGGNNSGTKTHDL